MKKYFVNGKQISESEAKEIEAKNNELMKSDDLSDWLNCKFINVID